MWSVSYKNFSIFTSTSLNFHYDSRYSWWFSPLSNQKCINFIRWKFLAQKAIPTLFASLVFAFLHTIYKLFNNSTNNHFHIKSVIELVSYRFINRFINIFIILYKARINLEGVYISLNKKSSNYYHKKYQLCKITF